VGVVVLGLTQKEKMAVAVVVVVVQHPGQARYKERVLLGKGIAGVPD
jgi:hypothetical protein